MTNIQIINSENYGSKMKTFNPRVNFLFCLRVNEILNKTFIYIFFFLIGFSPALHLQCMVVLQLSIVIYNWVFSYFSISPSLLQVEQRLVI